MSSEERSSASKESAHSDDSSAAANEDREDSDVAEEIQCDICKAVVEADAVRFRCDECEDYDVCGDCYFAAEGRDVHHHPLTKVAEVEVAHVVWQFKDPATSNSVLIGNWPAAVPSMSPDLSTKSVRGVLSLIEKSEMEERAVELHKIYLGQPYARRDGIVYCHIRTVTQLRESLTLVPTALPDAINPSMVFRDRPELAELLERSTVWIDRSLKHGNVLVHCQKGQKRSPTIVLAWLITKGFGASDAINLISRGYTNSRDYSATEPGRSWGERYRKERPLWVERLGEWARAWRNAQAGWVAKHGKLLQSWEVLHRASRPAAAEPDAKRARSEEKDKEKEESQSSQAKT